MADDMRRWDLWRRDPATGALTEMIGHSQTARSIASRLCDWTGYELDGLHRYGVTHVGGTFPLHGEDWLEDHPEEALLAAWTAGTPKAAANRQQALHAFWPALATAIDNFEAGFDASA